MIHLKIKLSDGRELSGIYSWVGVLERLAKIRDLRNVADWKLEAA